MTTGWLSPLIVDVLGGRQKFQVLHEIYQCGPMSVQELQERLGMSYMGVKQHCDSLEEDGFLLMERHTLGQGRPRHVFSLTAKGREIFVPQTPGLLEDILRAVEKIHGRTGVEKILYRVYQDRSDDLAKRVERFAVLRRARELAAQRRAEGYETRVERTKDHIVLIETDKPVRTLVSSYPLVTMLERAMFERVLGVKVERTEMQSGDVKTVRFTVGSTNSLVASNYPKPRLTGKKRKKPTLPQSSASHTQTQQIHAPEQKITRLAVVREPEPKRESLQLDLVDYINSLGG